MNAKEVRALKPGIYVIHWKSGGSSIAAVGVTADGWRWLAPLNWILPSDSKTMWRMVKRAISSPPTSGADHA